MLVVGIYASQVGNANALLFGTDYEGNVCGSKSGTRDLSSKPNLFNFELFDPITLTAYTTYAVCVTDCPGSLADFSLTYAPPIGPDPTTAICLYSQTQPQTIAEVNAAVTAGNCTQLTFPSQSFLYRCIPLPSSLDSVLQINGTVGNVTVTAPVNGTSFISTVIEELNQRGVSLEIFRDLYNGWPYILASAGVSVGLSFAWLLIMHIFAFLLVWLSILLVLVSLLGGTAYLWYQYYLIKSGEAVLGGELIIFEKYGLNAYVYNQTTFLVFAIIVSVFFVIMFLLMVTLRTRINLAIALIKVACRALRKMPSVFLMPYIKAILLLIATAWCIYTSLLLSTAGNVTTFSINGIPQATFTSNNLITYLTIYVVFGYYWAWNFIVAMLDTVVAGSVASWYWVRDKKKLPFFIVLPSFYRVIRYHLGSLALGSFLIALVEWIRYLLRRLEKTMNKSKNPVVVLLFKCVQCCFLCAERLLKFLTHYAYIEIAVYGYSFCKAARFAIQLITRNIIRVAVVDKVSDFVLFCSRIIITVVSTVIGNYWLLNNIPSPTFWAMPLLVMAVLAYGISYTFITVISMSITTIFLCFCEDSERNDGTAEKPYYMVKGLRKFMDRHAKDQSDLAK